MPAVPGFAHAVYIVKTTDNKYICRFSNKATAKHNLNISKLLLSRNIKVPDVSVHEFEDLCCETYPFIDGKTFYERMLEGITDKEKDKIYEQLFDLSHKIASVQYDSKSVNSHENIFAKTAEKMFAFVNPHEKKALAYADLNTKNVLLDKNDNVCALLDLDSVDERNFSFGFVSMMCSTKTGGYFSKKTVEKYTLTHPKSRLSMQKQIQIYNCLIWLYINIIRKHMLNLKAK